MINPIEKLIAYMENCQYGNDLLNSDVSRDKDIIEILEKVRDGEYVLRVRGKDVYTLKMPSYEDIKALDKEEEHRITLYNMSQGYLRLMVWEEGRKEIHLDEMGNDGYIRREIKTVPITKEGYDTIVACANKEYSDCIEELLESQGVGRILI